MNLPNFWYGSCSDDPLSENHTLMLGKFWFGEILAIFRPKLTVLRVFGSPDVFRLRKEPINSLSCVRTSVRTCVPVLQPRPFDIFFWFFAWSLVSVPLRWPLKKFWSKKFFDPPGGFLYPKNPFLAKNGLLSLYQPNAAINFSNFWYGNYPYGFLCENHSVYAGKILVRPLGGIFDPKNVKKSPPKIVIF